LCSNRRQHDGPTPEELAVDLELEASLQEQEEEE
jgi:hypothetical protein